MYQSTPTLFRYQYELTNSSFSCQSIWCCAQNQIAEGWLSCQVKILLIWKNYTSSSKQEETNIFNGPSVVDHRRPNRSRSHREQWNRRRKSRMWVSDMEEYFTSCAGCGWRVQEFLAASLDLIAWCFYPILKLWKRLSGAICAPASAYRNVASSNGDRFLMFLRTLNDSDDLNLCNGSLRKRPLVQTACVWRLAEVF